MSAAGDLTMLCVSVCRTHKLQVMRVESTDGKHQEIGLYLNNKDGTKVLDKVRSLQPYKPWQFKTSKPYMPSGV